MKKKWDVLWKSVLFSVMGAAAAGTVMAAVNTAVEMIRGDSIFGIEDLFPLSLWHMSTWAAAGLAVGLITGLLRPAGNKKNKRPSLWNFIFIYTYFALWMLIQGYLNIYLFAGLFNLSALLLNLLFLLIGAGLLVFILRIRFQKGRRPRPVFQGVLIAAAVSAVLFSLIYKSFFSSPPFHPVSFHKKGIAPPTLNVILLVWDAVRFDHIGCCGYPLPTTPRLDELASSGALFTQAIAHSSHTMESIPTLFSSLLTSSHNVNSITDALPKNLVILPQIFKSLNYRTAAVSFNPYISPPYGYKKGFNHYLAPSEKFVKIYKTIFGHLLEMSQRIPLFGDLTLGLHHVTRSVFLSESSLQSTDAAYITQKAVQWIDKDPSKPFFLFLHYEGGHMPYEAPAAFVQMFSGEKNTEPVTRFPEGVGMFLPFLEGEPLPPEKTASMKAHYDAKIRYHDEQLGLLVDHLGKKGLKENTLLVVVSDHGEEFYDHHGWAHGQSLYEELIHVPLVFYCPGVIPKGKKINLLSGLADIFPTILGLCGLGNSIHLSYAVEGVDLAAVIQEPETPSNRNPRKENENRFIVSELTQGRNNARSLRGVRYKVIEAVSGGEKRTMLFDLENDPGEKTDISRVNGDLTSRMLKILDQRIEKAEHKSFNPRRMSLDEQEKRILESLGYIRENPAGEKTSPQKK